MDKPFSQASENNKGPILGVLSRIFSSSRHVLEIGSGTGQHAIHFSANLPHLKWQPTDLLENHPGMQQWFAEYPQTNRQPPLELDVRQDNWPQDFDAVFTANTLHIMAWETVKVMLHNVAQHLAQGGLFAVYGPFNYNGKFTSESNARFNIWLKERAEHQGIRDFEQVNDILDTQGMQLAEDNEMPANNRLLVWRKANVAQ